MAKVAIRYCNYWITRFHAARVAARLRRELNTDVELVHGHYGEYKVLVDGEIVADGDALVILGVVPSFRGIVETVRKRLKAPPESDKVDSQPCRT